MKQFLSHSTPFRSPRRPDISSLIDSCFAGPSQPFDRGLGSDLSTASQLG